MNVMANGIEEIREKANYLKDKAVFEIDLVSGEIKWVNKYAVEILGYGFDQIVSMKIDQITPKEMHGVIQEVMADKASGKEAKISIWPIKTENGQIAWFYVYQTKTNHPLHWMQAEVVQSTETNGPSYVFMRMQVELSNQLEFVNNRIDDLNEFVKTEFKKVHEKYNHYDELLEDLVVRIEKVSISAERAADAAISAVTRMEQSENHIKNKLDNFEQMFFNESSKQTAKILQMIREENFTKKHMSDFEKNVKTTTEFAIKAIVNQSNESGKNLSKKVITTVSMIAIITIIIHYLLQY